MANEAVIVELYGWPPGEPRRYTCTDGLTISKGALLVLTDPRTVSASTVVAGGLQTQVFAGIAAQDKVANDGATSIAVYTNCLADLTTVTSANAANLPVVGEPVELSGANLIVRMSGAHNTTYLSGTLFTVGFAQETASSGEVILVRVRK